ncbi:MULTISPECIES: hypothetical protein [unclassified Azospirillum]|uniref:hypothetical protein n=1 Tax=unclassified Azospirillum TaxID=2630922 RepID=UPI000B648440|nr:MULTISPECIES: hypothetical protein [unclassified Azospirillum]SNT00645.1 hypothetical protein SAMN05880556_11876 [Azospirillum sp. RU38E]SNT16566.1 hypothetical protein SAMN05880591_11876 [Azospirillum sp. RU37A]
MALYGSRQSVPEDPEQARLDQDCRTALREVADGHVDSLESYIDQLRARLSTEQQRTVAKG